MPGSQLALCGSTPPDRWRGEDPCLARGAPGGEDDLVCRRHVDAEDGSAMSKQAQDARADRRSGHPGRAAAARAGAEPADPGAARSWLRSGWGVALLTVLAAVVLVVVIVSGGSDDPAPDPTGSEVARLEEQEAARDVAQVEQLTDVGREASEAIDPVVARMSELLPAEGPPETDDLASRSTRAGWARSVERVEALFGDPESASTGVNVARGALVGAVDAVEGAVRAYDDALALPPGRHRTAALERAAESLHLGVRLWSVAATQLDELNVQAGFGHQHIHLSGATPPDGLPEGTDAH